MQYVCLAAGKGTRMGALGSYLQKCMYPVGLRPFLDYSLAELLASAWLDAGTDRLAIVIGHHGDQVRRYFGDEYGGLEIEYVVQDEPLGTGHALALAFEALKPTESVTAWLADSYVPREIFDAVRAHPLDNVQTLGPGSSAESPSVRASVDGDRIARSWDGDGELYDIGVWKLAPGVLEAMTQVQASNGEYRALPNLQRSLEAGVAIGWVEAAEWVHLGGIHPTPEDNVAAVVERLSA